MNNHTIDTTLFVSEFVDALEIIFTRMGWFSGRDNGSISVAVPPDEEWVFKWAVEDILV